MAIRQINISKSSNGIPVYGAPYSDGKEYLLTPNVSVAVVIPSNVNMVLLTYSAGATVKSLLGEVGASAALPTDDSGQDTIGRFNVQMVPVQQYDTAGNQQYLHLISPNPADMVTVTFFNGAT